MGKIVWILDDKADSTLLAYLLRCPLPFESYTRKNNLSSSSKCFQNAVILAECNIYLYAAIYFVTLSYIIELYYVD